MPLSLHPVCYPSPAWLWGWKGHALGFRKTWMQIEVALVPQSPEPLFHLHNGTLTIKLIIKLPPRTK